MIIGPVGILLATLMVVDMRARTHTHTHTHTHILQHVCTISLLVFLTKKGSAVELHLPDAGYPDCQLPGSPWLFG